MKKSLKSYFQRSSLFWLAIVVLLSSCGVKSHTTSPLGADRAIVKIQDKDIVIPDPSSSQVNENYFAKALIADVTSKLIQQGKIAAIDTDITLLGGPPSSSSALGARGAVAPVVLEEVEIRVPRQINNPNQCLIGNGAPVCVSICSFAEAHAVASASAYGFGVGQCAGGGTAWASAGASAFASASASATACASACSDGTTSASASFSSSFSWYASFFGAGGFRR